MSGELVYLVFPDGGVVDRLSRALHSAGFKVLSMKSEDEAEEVIANFKYVLPDVLLTPLDDPENGDSILFRLLVANPLMEQVPVVILSSGDQEQRRQALRRGLTNLVFPPYDHEEVILTTRLALDRHRDENRLFGSLSQLSVPDLLQTVEVGRRSGAITLRHQRIKGTIWFRNGVIIDGAVDDGRVGEEAVYAMAVWDEGTFEADFNPVSVPERFSLAPSVLLLDAMRRYDEEQRDRAGSGNGRDISSNPDELAMEEETRLTPAAAQASPPVRRPSGREAVTIHVALALLNIAASHARHLLNPQLLHRRLEGIRQQLEHQYPELRIFQVTPEGMVAIAFDVTVVLHPEEIVTATSRWVDDFLTFMTRAMPGRFTRTRFFELTRALHDDMRREGFFDALGITDSGGRA